MGITATAGDNRLGQGRSKVMTRFDKVLAGDNLGGGSSKVVESDLEGTFWDSAIIGDSSGGGRLWVKREGEQGRTSVGMEGPVLSASFTV